MSSTAEQDINRTFAQAEAAYAQGRTADAAALLATVRQAAGPNAAVLHLSALVAKRGGQANEAARFFTEALRLQPNDPQILTNFGNLLAETGNVQQALEGYGHALAANGHFLPALVGRAALLLRIGQEADALADLKRAEAVQPGAAQVHSMKGSALLALGEIRRAAEAFDRALQLDPNRLPALTGRAGAAMQLGDSEAPDLLRRALALRPNDPELMLQLAEALEQEGDPEGVAVLQQAVGRNPQWIKGQLALARMRWEAGDSAGFTKTIEEDLQKAPRQTGLWEALTIALATADQHEAAAGAARRGQAAIGFHPGLAMFEAVESSEAGDLAAAGAAFAKVPAAMPGIELAEARHRLRLRQLERAQQLLDRARAKEPWDITAWALQGILWRLTDDPRNAWLHEQPGLVAAHELPLSPQEITQIAERLRSLHQTKAHPLGQSLRGGTQTRGRLFERLEPEVQRLRAAVEDVLALHWSALPPRDDAHPLLRHRDRTPRLEGSWSVRLSGSGYHVSHIHPRGVVSSASYFVVPQAVQPGDGFLEVGAAPPELGLGLGPLAAFEPVPGRMVLFPSTMYHGTRPFPEGERLTAAFDVIPA